MKRIKVLGDSHVQAFNAYSGNDYKFDVKIVHGATARGSINPNTKTNALNIFKDHLKNEKLDKIIICLGEVDCGYLIWYKQKIEGLDPIEQMEESLRRLKQFVQNEIATIYNVNDIILLGSIPPTIKDNTDKRFLAGARSEVDASLNERMELTRIYNIEMQKMCLEMGWKCIDVFDEVIDSNTSYIKEKYLNQNPSDHHLNPNTHIKLIIRELNQL